MTKKIAIAFNAGAIGFISAIMLSMVKEGTLEFEPAFIMLIFIVINVISVVLNFKD